MSLISLIVVLVVVGFLLWLANAYIPMAEPVKKVLNIAVVVFLVLWLLAAFGLLDGVNDIRVGDG